jgi:hypothetical protein
MLCLDSNAEPGTLVVKLPGVGTYELHHGWEPGVETWIDGKIIFSSGHKPLQLDIACTGDEFIIDTPTHEVAVSAWNAGSVCSAPLEGGAVLTLVVPGATLCEATVLEALSRFRP